MTESAAQHKLGKYTPVQPSIIRAKNGCIVVCMGPSGAGKTTLLETLHPTYAPVCVLDVDHKTHVLTDRQDRDIYPCYTFQQLDEHVQALLQERLHPYYRTIVIDGTTMMQVGLAWGKHNVDKIDNPQLRQGAFGRANSDMLDLGASLRTLAESGTNIIYNIWSTVDKDESNGAITVNPDLTPTMLTRFLGILDFVVYLEPNSPPNPYPPIMRTGGSQRYGTRTATSPDSPLRNMPPLIYKPSWTSIFDSFSGAPWPTALHTK